MKKTSLTIADISRETGFPESTVRFYRDKFEHYIPYVGEGRKRRYEPKAIDIFCEIAKLSNKGLTITDIETYLGSKYAHNPIIVEDLTAEPQFRNTSAATATEPQYNENPVTTRFTRLPSIPETAVPQHFRSSAVTAIEQHHMVSLMEIMLKNNLPKEPEKIYCTVKEAAARTGLSQDFIKKNCREFLETRKGIPCARTGRGYVIHKTMLDDWFTNFIKIGG